MKPSGLAHLCEKVSIKKLRTILLGFERSFSQIIEPVVGLVILFFEKLDNAKLSSQLLS